MFKEMNEYSHIHSKDANIIVTEIIEINNNFIKLSVVWVAKNGPIIFSPDMITVKKKDLNKWLKI